MRHLPYLRERLLAFLTLGTLMTVSVAAFSSPGRSASEQAAQAFQSPFQSPIQIPTPLPTPQPSCPLSTRWATLATEITVEGLGGDEIAELQLLPDNSVTSLCLSMRGVRLPKDDLRNGLHSITITDVPDGSYKLVIRAPVGYFREPQGYLFQVSDGAIVRHTSRSLQFKLIPLSEQNLPPCRQARPTPSVSTTAATRDAPFKPQVICKAEPLIDVSSFPKQPEPRESSLDPLSGGYHYVGPETSQDNRGVWGRNYVVDPSVGHLPVPFQFVAERVYADYSSHDRWMEAGWAEVSWRDDKQYVYEYDSVTFEWHFFDQFTLSSGSAVETLVEYRPDVGTWWALYYLGGSSWAVLAEEPLGFSTASQGYNRGEVYTDDDSHPVLPLSGFDTGYLKISDVWRIWDTRYSTFVRQDPPYQCDMIQEYNLFNIHSPIAFIPFVMKDQ